MDWYYAANGQQVGPVSEEQFEQLIRSGTLQPTSLVWREGLPEWQTLQAVRGAAPATSAMTPPPLSVALNQSPCAECQRVFPQSEMVFLNRCWVCAECKPIFVQRMKEGVGPVGSQLWRLKRQLVCRPEAVLPDRCVKCNEPTHGQRLKRQLYWHPPAFYALILINLLVYVLVAVIVRKRARLDIGLCERHRQRRVWVILSSWVSVLGGVVLAIYGFTNNLEVLGAFASLAAIVGGITGGVLGPQIAAAKIDKEYVWVKGVCHEYLDTLPEWSGSTR
jgi:hypothetical protein